MQKSLESQYLYAPNLALTNQFIEYVISAEDKTADKK